MSAFAYQALGMDDDGSKEPSLTSTSLSSKSIGLSFQGLSDARSWALNKVGGGSAKATAGGLGGSIESSLIESFRPNSTPSSKNVWDDDARKFRWDKPSRLIRCHRGGACFRFSLLFLSVLIVFSGYFQFDLPAITAEKMYIKFDIGAAEYSIIFVGYSISNTIVPLLSGPFFGKFGKWRGVTLIAITITFGIAVVWLGVLMGGKAGYNVLVLGRTIYGLGGESVFVGVDILVTKWFQGAEIGFAYGLIQAAGQAGSFTALYSVPTLVKSYWDGNVNNAFMLSFILSCSALSALGLARIIEKTAYGKRGAYNNKTMGDGHMHQDTTLQHNAAGGFAVAVMDGVASERSAAVGAGKGRNSNSEKTSLLKSEGGSAGASGQEEEEEEEEEPEEEDTETESEELKERLKRNLSCLKCFPPLYHAILYLGFGHLTTLGWRFYAVMGGIISYSSAFYTFLAWGPQWLEYVWGMDPVEAGQTAGIIAIFSMIISPSSGLLMDKRGGQRYVCFCAMVSAFVWFTVMGFTSTPPAVCIVFAGMSYSLLPASLYPLLPEVVPAESFTIVYAVLNSAINLVFTVVLLISGKVLGADTTENLRRARMLQHDGSDDPGSIDPGQFKYLFAIFMSITACGCIATGLIAWDGYKNGTGWVPLANKH